MSLWVTNGTGWIVTCSLGNHGVSIHHHTKIVLQILLSERTFDGPSAATAPTLTCDYYRHYSVYSFAFKHKRLDY